MGFLRAGWSIVVFFGLFEQAMGGSPEPVASENPVCTLAHLIELGVLEKVHADPSQDEAMLQVPFEAKVLIFMAGVAGVAGHPEKPEMPGTPEKADGLGRRQLGASRLLLGIGLHGKPISLVSLGDSDSLPNFPGSFGKITIKGGQLYRVLSSKVVKFHSQDLDVKGELHQYFGPEISDQAWVISSAQDWQLKT